MRVTLRAGRSGGFGPASILLLGAHEVGAAAFEPGADLLRLGLAAQSEQHQGRIEQIGTPQQVYREPATRFVANFLGAVNWIGDPVEVPVALVAEIAAQ